jgi:cell shape-determining protein MreD
MIRHLAWAGLGFLGVTFWTAVAARVPVGHIVPDAAVVTVVFLALRRDPIPVVLTALVLGYLVGRQALAPVGLHETALTIVSVAAYMVSGRLAGGGAAFCAVATAVATLAYHVLLFLLIAAAGGEAQFSSWVAAALVPASLATGLLALLSYPLLSLVERKLAPEVREGLSWH